MANNVLADIENAIQHIGNRSTNISAAASEFAALFQVIGPIISAFFPAAGGVIKIVTAGASAVQGATGAVGSSLGSNTPPVTTPATLGGK